MKAFSTGSAVAGQRVSTYTSFVGVDFSTDPMLVDQSHSPYALNLMADEGGRPEKRPGWRTLQRMEGKINGLFRCEMGDKEHYLCHAGTKIWKLDMTGGVTAQNLLKGEPFDWQTFLAKVEGKIPEKQEDESRPLDRYSQEREQILRCVEQMRHLLKEEEE